MLSNGDDFVNDTRWGPFQHFYCDSIVSRCFTYFHLLQGSFKFLGGGSLGHPVCDCVSVGNVLHLYELKMLSPGLGFCEGVARSGPEVCLGVVSLANFEFGHKGIQGEVIFPLFGFLCLLS